MFVSCLFLLKVSCSARWSHDGCASASEKWLVRQVLMESTTGKKQTPMEQTMCSVVVETLYVSMNQVLICTNVHTMSYDLIVPRFHRLIFLHATSGLTRRFSVGYIPSTRITCWPGIAPTSALNVSSRMVSVGVHSRCGMCA
jgi:hypothetical protein